MEERRINIYVGNLPYEATRNELETFFSNYGEVLTARVITDRETGRSRGFGFVEMSKSSETEAAIQGLNGKDLKGRALTVNEAKPREQSGGQSRGFNRQGGSFDRLWLSLKFEHGNRIPEAHV